jgi:hypothetical protein
MESGQLLAQLVVKPRSPLSDLVDAQSADG